MLFPHIYPHTLTLTLTIEIPINREFHTDSEVLGVKKKNILLS